MPRRLISAAKRNAMDGVNAYLRRRLDFSALIDVDPIPPFIHSHFQMVYFSIFFATLCTIGGVYLHFAGEIGGWFTSLGFLGSVICFVMTRPWREWKRFSFMMAGAFLLGASFIPWIQPFINIDPRLVIASLVGRALCFGTFLVGTMGTRDRADIYCTGFIYCSLLLLIWLVVALCFFINNAAYVAVMFLELTLFPLHLVVYSQEMVVKDRTGELDFVVSAIRFFTDYAVVSIYSLVLIVRHFGGL